ncbi:SHOCT domain-containing protein [Streptomyces sp. NPDC050448]|uniref:SHOCT domain-containing protein n=1 Tax=Streptomyces sp. NPDC050448 TaxID=3155404 RepID=UPI00343843E9
MFIRPIGVTVQAANRPAGRPLLRGLLSRAAGATAPAGEATAETAEAAEAAEPVSPGERAAEPGAPPGGPAAEPGAPPVGLAAELAQLAELAREGLLTPQEFTEAKARLLHP